MAQKESTQHKLDRVRPPRVQITYDVQIGDAIEKKELPFVLGVCGDFSGQPKDPLPRMKDRKFVAVDRDNFDDVLKGCAPRLAYRVDNKMGTGNENLNVELNFSSLEDFHPTNVSKQVEPLRRLLEVREKLADLRNKMLGNDKLEELLGDILRNTQQLQALAKETGRTGGDGKKA